MSDRPFILNEAKKRFELEVDGHIAFIECILTNDNVMFLTHTEVPTILGGKGVGGRIVENALNYIKEHGYTLAPLCPFVAKYLRIHPEWQTLLAKGYKV
jgi:predicted GNAT family acetyltransferase